MEIARTSSFLLVAEEILDGYERALATLDDETVNVSPVPGVVNAPFALVTHVHGMASFWMGSFVAGEAIPRDREAEFLATGTVAEALALVEAIRRRLPAWVEVARTEGIRDRSAKGSTLRDHENATPDWVLDHVLHELAQHGGHLEVCRDVVVAQRGE